MCVACREMKPKKELLRVVKAPDGAVSIDAAGRAQGRGAYICVNAECVRSAEKRRGFEKNLDAADCGLIYKKLLEICEDAKDA